MHSNDKRLCVLANISNDIKSIVNKCEKCLANFHRNQKEPYIPFDIPIVTWKSIATNLFVFNDKICMFVVDLFSRVSSCQAMPWGKFKSCAECLQSHIQ